MTIITDLSYFQASILATIGNTIEVYLQHPLNIIKNNSQYGLKQSFTIRELYRGIFINAGSMSFITATQFMSFSFFSNNLKTNSFTSSLLAGACSSIITTPFELGVIQKTKTPCANSYSIFKSLQSKYGNKFITRGFSVCCVRESIYTCGLLSLTPFIEKKLPGQNKTRNSLYASCISGAIAGIISHPFDTIKANQQYFLYDKINYKELFTIKNLSRGIVCRTWRIITTFFIINESNKFFIQYI